MSTVTTQPPFRKIYRIPPARNGTYLIFRREGAKFCVRSKEVSAVLPFQQIPLTPGNQADTSPNTPSSAPVIDVGYEMGAATEITTSESLLLAIRSEPVSYIAIDEILSVQTQGREALEGPFDELIRDMVVFEDETIPLIDSQGVAKSAWDDRKHSSIVIPAGMPPSKQKTTDIDSAAPLNSVAAGDSTPPVEFEQTARQFVEQFGIPEVKGPRTNKLYDICVIGGLGHVGLPLGLSFADAGRRVVLYDINEAAIKQVSAGHMPFLEQGAEPILKQVLGQNLHVSSDKNVIRKSYFVVIVIGTPVDEHLNPQFSTFMKFIDSILDVIDDDQHIILRSTVYPGTTEKVKKYLAAKGKRTRVSFCPERITQGNAIEELSCLPQIVSSFDQTGLDEVKELFSSLTGEILELTPTEAELGKLFANVWRYVQFAISNQFYQIAAQKGIDFYRIHDALTKNYPRLAGMSRPGFAAGPCLFKDTMQLAAFSNNNFFLGHAAMLINEGLPNFIIQMLKDKYPLEELTVGILGMAFKANNDDKRSSLSYKLRKMLQIDARCVYCTDLYLHEEDFIEPNELIEKSDIIIVATPHKEYSQLQIDDQKILVDIWNFYNRGGLF